MFKKILSLCLALLMVAGIAVSMVSCGEKTDDFKLGVILLHDEASTYDLNFIEAVERAKEQLGLTDAQVIYKKNIPESNACYEAAADLVDEGCDIIFADSFGHETYMIKAAKEFTDVQFCHATGTMAHTEGLANFHNAFASIYEGRFLAGVAAGLKLNEMIVPVAPGEEHWLLDTSLDEVYWPCSHSRATPSFPSQLEWKIGLPWANTRGILNSPS